jgi:hypothetical protein
LGPRLVAVVKADCPTCQLVAPVLRGGAGGHDPTSYTQDDPTFPAGVPGLEHDDTLERSHRLGIEAVPTLLQLAGREEVARAVGWDRDAWAELTGRPDLGDGLPPHQPGCGARNVEPGMPERLALRFGEVTFRSRLVDVDPLDDPIEVAYDRGWSDGLPVVPPTELRVARMLAGTTRSPDEVVGRIPPNLNECTVEKVAVNAVLAGCRPEYLPVVLAAVEAALQPRFAMHGLLCTLHFAGPVVVVNGPIARRIGMNWGGNALGQGNRANATIGRALQLVIRNVGGGRPGEIDRATLGNPGKYTFCFAEDETDPGWQPVSVARGFPAGASTVTLFHGEGVRGFTDWDSRTPEELTRSLALALWGVTHPKAALGRSAGAMVVMAPNHQAIYADAGWDRRDIEDSLFDAMRRPAAEVARGVGGVPGGVDPALGDELVDKLPRENFLLVRAGGEGGLHSAIVGGWSGQRNPDEIQIVTEEIRS